MVYLPKQTSTNSIWILFVPLFHVSPTFSLSFLDLQENFVGIHIQTISQQLGEVRSQISRSAKPYIILLVGGSNLGYLSLSDQLNHDKFVYHLAWTSICDAAL